MRFEHTKLRVQVLFKLCQAGTALPGELPVLACRALSPCSTHLETRRRQLEIMADAGPSTSAPLLKTDAATRKLWLVKASSRDAPTCPRGAMRRSHGVPRPAPHAQVPNFVAEHWHAACDKATNEEAEGPGPALGVIKYSTNDKGQAVFDLKLDSECRGAAGRRGAGKRGAGRRRAVGAPLVWPVSLGASMAGSLCPLAPSLPVPSLACPRRPSDRWHPARIPAQRDDRRHGRHARLL
jgi:hypothetical protein